MRRLLAPCLFVIGCGSSGPSGPQPTITDGPPLSGDKYELTWGPVQVAPGQESTQCIWVRLPITTELKVHQLLDTLSPSSHHLIVYKDDKDTTEQTTPMPCQPFTGALNTTGMIAPIAITQKKDDEIT